MGLPDSNRHHQAGKGLVADASGCMTKQLAIFRHHGACEPKYAYDMADGVSRAVLRVAATTCTATIVWPESRVALSFSYLPARLHDDMLPRRA